MEYKKASKNKGGLNMFAMDYIYFPAALNLYLAEAKCVIVILVFIVCSLCLM